MKANDPMAGKSTDEQIGLLAQIREDWNIHGRDWTLPGFRALAVHRIGVWRMRIRHRLLRAPLSALYKFLFRHVRNHYGIELPHTATIGRRVLIAHQGTIVFHESARVGDECIIRHGVTLGAPSHRRSHEAPTLGCGVQVGAGAMILGNITIGDGAAIGANAVVTTDMPPFSKAIVTPTQIIPASLSRPNQPDEPGQTTLTGIGHSSGLFAAFLLVVHRAVEQLQDFSSGAVGLSSPW